MTYKEKFRASQDKAHYQNIATKILSEMSELRSKVENSPTMPRRWIWELIQNAKDVHANGGVKIRIEFDHKSTYPKIVFRHNGQPFTADNIRFLIEQISTKDRTKDKEGKRKTTGKFRTGFLTTHLLSEKVTVKAVAKEPELDYRKFELVLDRSGFDLDQITEAVRKAKQSVENLDELSPFLDYMEGEFNTAFYYNLEDDVSLKVARSGLKDLNNCLPFTLSFIEEIESVEILSGDRTYYVKDQTESLDDNIKVLLIKIEEPTGFKNKPNYLLLLLLSKGFTSIAIPVKLDEGNTLILQPISDEIPRLFCNFPLLGTEIIPFPVIVNNPNFNPTDPRDGIFLTDSQRSNPQIDENKGIIRDAIDLYFQLLECATSQNWKNLHLLAHIHELRNTPHWISETWFKNEILNPIRKKLLHSNIVNTAIGGPPVSILTKDGKKYMWFPNSSKKEIREKIWQLAKDWFPRQLPQQEDIEIWHKLSWNECGKLTVDKLAVCVESCETLDNLTSKIKNKDVYEWLHDFYALLKLEEKEFDFIINNRAIFPNQNGVLCKKEHLWKDNGDIIDLFKDILKLLGKDIRDELADVELDLSFTSNKVRNKTFVVKDIASEVIQKIYTL